MFVYSYVYHCANLLVTHHTHLIQLFRNIILIFYLKFFAINIYSSGVQLNNSLREIYKFCDVCIYHFHVHIFT